MINLTITSNLTGEVLSVYENLNPDDAICIIEERQRTEEIGRLVDEIENDDSIPDDQKARLYPGLYELMQAERHNLDAFDPASESYQWEEDERQWINANHDRLTTEWDKYAI